MIQKPFSVSGRVVDRATRRPAAGIRMQAWDGERRLVDLLGETMTDADGNFEIRLGEAAYRALFGDRPPSIFFKVFNGQELMLDTEETIRWTLDVRDTGVLIEIEFSPVPASPTLSQMTEMLPEKMPDQLLAFLAERGIRSLADIRQAGGLRDLPGLPVPPDHPLLGTLEAHAQLSTLSQDARTNARLIAKGYTQLAALARMPRSEFLRDTHAILGDFTSAQFQRTAFFQTRLLDSIATGLRADVANGFIRIDGLTDTVVGRAVRNIADAQCDCPDCEAAASPAAYLADLLDYAVRHVTEDGRALTLQALVDRLQQPFADLPVSCDAVDSPVRQVRLCVEVLRRHLAQTRRRLPDPAERAYVLDAYTALLTRLGTSYEELRLARSAEPDQRQQLADRLGVNLSPREGLFRNDELDRLLLDPDAPPPPLVPTLPPPPGPVLPPAFPPPVPVPTRPRLEPLGEAALERLFGMVDTTRDPLSGGAKQGDAQNQITRWNLEGAAWNRNTDRDGNVYLTVARRGGVFHVEVYRDPSMTQRVASGVQSSATGAVPLRAQNRSGLSGEVVIAYRQDASFSLNLVPGVLAWQLRRLRTQWAQQDFPAQPEVGRLPLIDPDLIGPADFRDPDPDDPAFRIWAGRRRTLDQRLGSLRQQRESAATDLAGFDAILQGQLGLIGEALLALAAGRDQGDDITASLAERNLANEAFNFLLRVRRLAASGANILESEWNDVYAILVQAQKRSLFEAWRAEEREGGLTLGPDYFQIPPVDVTEFPPPEPEPLPAFRATDQARRDWQDTLQARLDQQQTVIEAWRALVAAVEETSLPVLRDALISASDAPGTSIAPRANVLAERLLIDMQAGGCQTTTRVAQAIETIQSLLNGLRSAQLTDTHPGLALNADYFDEEWQWLGSYATWRAALFVFLYPENILLPYLRKWQTPAFRTLVESLRQNRRLTPAQACEAANAYADYFRDVCTLRLEVSCQTRTRLHAGDDCRNRSAAGYGHLLYAFARGGATGTVYWSAFDPNDGTGYAQSFWEAVPGLEDALQLLGAAPYELAPDQRFIFLFARTRGQGAEKLMLIRYDLERQMWDGAATELELPKDEGEDTAAFTAVVLQRAREDVAPQLALRVPSGALYQRSLGRDGADWQDAQAAASQRNVTPEDEVQQAPADSAEDWPLLVGRLKGQDYATLCAAVEVAPGEFYLVMQHLNGSLWYRLFGARDDGLWRPCTHVVQTPANTDERQHTAWATGACKGVFAWPGTQDIYVFWGDGAPTTYQVIHYPASDPQRRRFRSLRDFDARWLRPVTGDSLDSRFVNATSLTYLEFFSGQTVQELREVLSQLSGKPDSELSDAQVITKYAREAHDQIEAIASLIENDPAASDLRLADRLARQFVNRSLRDVLVAILVQQFASNTSLLAVRDALVAVFETGEALSLPEFPSRSADNLSTFLTLTTGLQRIAPDAGAVPSGRKRYALQNSASIFWARFRRQGEQASLGARINLAPVVTGPFDITQQVGTVKAQSFRKALIQLAFESNSGGPESNLEYLREAYYFVPIHLALQLQSRGEYTAALDWFRTVYDYSLPLEARKVSYLLEQENDGRIVYQRAADWLRDPLNPHLIAAQRPRTYTRFTLLSLVRCFLEFADSEFTRDTAESVARARSLYLSALELLGAPELAQQSGLCDQLLGELDIQVGDARWQPVWLQLRREIGRISEPAVLRSITTDLKRRLSTESDAESVIRHARGLIAPVLASSTKRLGAVLDETDLRDRLHSALLADAPVFEAVSQVGAVAQQDYVQAASLVTGLSPEVLGRKEVELAWLREPLNGVERAAVEYQPERLPEEYRRLAQRNAPSHSSRLLQLALRSPVAATIITLALPPVEFPAPRYGFCVPGNPVLRSLRLRGELNLYKLRNCRNIAGQERALDPYAAATDAETGLPFIGAGGQLVVPGAVHIQPTPYRYSALVERARQLAQIAGQMEAAMLSALERRDAEAYTSLKARQDVRLTRAGVRLQDLRVKEAQGGVKLAELQQDRTRIQQDHFKQLLQEPVSSLEQQSLELQRGAQLLQIEASVMAAIPNIIAGLATGAIVDFTGIYTSAAQALSTQATILSTLASYERRTQEWEYQQSLVQQDGRIAAQQLSIAEDRVRVVGQEHAVAELQADNAEHAVEFLSAKFTTVELFDWMSDTLGQVYAFFLQQATAVAKLAENQLAFERQEVPPAFIQADYWEAPDASVSATDGRGPDRRGLTGSARLLQDIYQLDQYAFENNKRKLQLTKTVSLARLAPFEFQRFRESGVLNFTTPMELFDRDFPGHYLRLIRRVRTSVVALIPPTQGIHATLTHGGSSRVVIGGGTFQTATIQRGPQSVALTSPRDAAGTFELEPPSDLLLPFEGTGVDTTWEFSMPRAANFFDYRTIADVLITIEYTALNSFDYRQQVIRTLRPDVSAERPFSFRHQFADPWYDLHNPDQSATPMTVKFTTTRDDFPPNLSGVQIRQLVLYLATADGRMLPAFDVELQFTPAGGAQSAGGRAAPVANVISTRRGNAPSWNVIAGNAPVGEWTLVLPDTAEVRDLFRREAIEDILFVITYEGRTPPWP